jgi:tetraacyldisaccharide 4'-kinase
MSFNFYLLRGVRLLLFPFSLIYALVVLIRNYCYDRQWMRTTSFNLPIICVGNLSVGGTGKSPMTELLIEMLLADYKIATISRGYKRKTKGYLLATENTTALEIGDEPMQFYSKFKNIAVAVGEERIEAVPQLLQDRPETEVIILDDAFQHRAIAAGFNIILTDYNNPYWDDWFLPSGDLRDQASSAKRAQAIVVTKCPANLTSQQRERILQSIAPLPSQHVFFTTFAYGVPYHIITGAPFQLHQQAEVLLVCGIANPEPLKKHLEWHAGIYHLMSFHDHHIFSIDDLHQMRQKLDGLEAAQKIILTTEKDAVRLMKFGAELHQIPLYVQPVKHEVLFNQYSEWSQLIKGFVSNFSNTPTQS